MKMITITSKTKQVIVIRRDLKMRRGKEIAQGAHAAMAFLSNAIDPFTDKVFLTPAEREWLRSSFTKVTCQVNSEQELMDIYFKAKDSGVKARLITDNGTTEFDGVPTRTAIAIGPDYADIIDKITGELKLY